MKNNCSPRPLELQKSHVVYEYKCALGNCAALNNSYIGMTLTKLSRRLTCHLQNGTPKQHTWQEHRTTLTRDMLVEGTKILESMQDQRRLAILEAIYIKDQTPAMNLQNMNLQALPSMRPTMASHGSPPDNSPLGR